MRPGWRQAGIAWAALAGWALAAPLPAALGQTVVAKTRPAAMPPAPVAPPPVAEPGVATATSADITTERTRTRLTVQLSHPVRFDIFTLADPFRVIIDLENLTFQLPETAGPQPPGLIRAFRYGEFAPGKARIVIDAAGPVRVLRSELRRTRADTPARLVIELEAVDRAAFVAALPPRVPARPVPQAAPSPRSTEKPVIVIDAGHGGIDPGAISPGALKEKDVVLAVAQRLRTLLATTGRYDVRMTRSSDVFISLDQRVAISRSNEASLFISIHADSISDKHAAETVRGATVYTLSEQASSQEAQQLADKENAADRLAGVDSGGDEDDDQVKTILFDLMKRETLNYASHFKTLSVTNLRRALTLARDPARAAGFKVLRQAHSPAVLIELGYMTHAEDAKLLQSPIWQRQVAGAIGAAVDQFFANRQTSLR